MTNSFQRLLLIIVSLIFLTAAIFLILLNSKNNLVFFYTPSELLSSKIKINDTIRIGGFVEKNSIISKGNNQFSFIITDNKNSLKINFKGLLPDLFKDEQGAIIEGVLLENYIIKASAVFAKHDENYMPESIKKELQNNNYWKKKY